MAFFHCRPSYIYTLFVAIDANFRLKRRMASSNERGLGLNQGWACFVEDKGYRKHLEGQWDAVQEVFRPWFLWILISSDGGPLEKHLRCS